MLAMMLSVRLGRRNVVSHSTWFGVRGEMHRLRLRHISQTGGRGEVAFTKQETCTHTCTFTYRSWLDGWRQSSSLSRPALSPKMMSSKSMSQSMQSWRVFVTLTSPRLARRLLSTSLKSGGVCGGGAAAAAGAGTRLRAAASVGAAGAVGRRS